MQAKPVVNNTSIWINNLHKSGFKFPTSYIVFDCETTGLDPNLDFIVQFAHIFVDNKVPRSDIELILNWADCSNISQSHLNSRINNIQRIFNGLGKRYLFTRDVMQRDGVDPFKLLSIYLDMFKAHQNSGGYFLTHNGFRFDTIMLEHHFKRFLNEDFKFDCDRVIDTGLIEKANQCELHTIKENETITNFYHRCDEYRARGVMWSLDKWCVPRYRLAEMHSLDMRKAHTAGFDCYATHLLFEEFRKMVH